MLSAPRGFWRTLACTRRREGIQHLREVNDNTTRLTIFMYLCHYTASARHLGFEHFSSTWIKRPSVHDLWALATLCEQRDPDITP